MDGKRRRVERSGTKSAEDARRLLQQHLAERRTPLSDQLVTERTTLFDLFELWLAAKSFEDGVKAQTCGQYRQVWETHGAGQLGALRVTELPTSRANAHVQSVAVATPSQAAYLRIILRTMFSMAVRFDVLAVNPIVDTETAKLRRKPPRAMTPAEFDQVRAAVKVYASREGHGGPKPGRLLPASVEVLAATGARPNARKGDAPAHTVVLPRFGVEAFTTLLGETGPTGPVFANRNGGWMSLANLRRALRAALPAELTWITPHSFRRTVATVVRDDLGPALAQQLSHSKLSTTEAHYLQRHTHGPDVRSTLDRFAAGTMPDERGGKVSDGGDSDGASKAI